MSTLEADAVTAWGLPHDLAEEVLDTQTTAQDDTEVDFTLPASGYGLLRLDWWNVEVDTDQIVLGLQFSDDALVSVYNSAGDYHNATRSKSVNSVERTMGGSTDTLIQLTDSVGGLGNHAVDIPAWGSVYIKDWEVAKNLTVDFIDSQYEAPTAIGTDEYTSIVHGSSSMDQAVICDGMRVMLTGGGAFDAGAKFRLTGFKEFT